MSAKKPTYLKDSYIDYVRILLAVIMVAAVSFTISRGFETMRLKHTSEMVDVTSYLKDAKKLTVINEGHYLISLEYSQFNNDNEYLTNNPLVVAEFTKNDDGTEVVMKLVTKKAKHFKYYQEYGASLLVYGPSLDSIEVSGPIDMTYSGDSSLSVVNKGSRFSIRAGDRYENLKITNDVGATSRLDNAYIKNLEVNLKDGLITTSQVDTLKAELPTECAYKAHTGLRRSLMIESVSADSILYNGVERPTQSVSNECSKLVVGA